MSEDRGDTWSPLSNNIGGTDLIVTPPLADRLFYNLYTGCEDGVCRSVNEGVTWVFNNNVPRAEMFAVATDGERAILYMTSPGGLVNTASTRDEIIPGLGSVSGGGVYRLTERLEVS